MSAPEVRVFADADEVATRAAEAVIAHLSLVLGEKPEAHLVVTGGTVGILTLAKLSSIDDGLDWNRVHIWWGDERFVEHDSADRNAVQARNAWLTASIIPESNIHEFPASNQGLSLDEAAISFDETLARFGAGAAHPQFDILLLGMGPDGHIASLFPGKPQPEAGLVTLAEHDSPKPPPARLSMTYDVINSADQVWFTVAGADKADAVEVAFSDSPEALPVGRVRGTAKTVWFVDKAAASKTAAIS
jgi:6-phosphogluconolactonase